MFQHGVALYELFVALNESTKGLVREDLLLAAEPWLAEASVAEALDPELLVETLNIHGAVNANLALFREGFERRRLQEIALHLFICSLKERKDQPSIIRQSLKMAQALGQLPRYRDVFGSLVDTESDP